MTAPDITPTDEELITLVNHQEGSSQAFETLYDRYREGIRRRLLSIVHSEAAAEDLLQETFLRVWLRANQWNGQGAFSAWLYRIATNLALNWLRTLRRRLELPLVMPDEGPWDEWLEDSEPTAPGWIVEELALGPQGMLETSEQTARLAGLVNALPAEKREVFRLVHEFELSIRTVADHLGVPEGTVKSRLHYADQKVRQELRRQE